MPKGVNAVEIVWPPNQLATNSFGPIFFFYDKAVNDTCS
jgi:hypothetical protein